MSARPFYLDAPALIACAAESGHQLRLKYADGVTGRVFLGNLLDIGAFKLFRDPRVFAAARLDSATGAVLWPAGIRLDASILYQDLRARGARPRDADIDVDFQRFLKAALVPVKLAAPRKGGKQK